MRRMNGLYKGVERINHVYEIKLKKYKIRRRKKSTKQTNFKNHKSMDGTFFLSSLWQLQEDAQLNNSSVFVLLLGAIWVVMLSCQQTKRIPQKLMLCNYTWEPSGIYFRTRRESSSRWHLSHGSLWQMTLEMFFDNVYTTLKHTQKQVNWSLSKDLFLLGVFMRLCNTKHLFVSALLCGTFE